MSLDTFDNLKLEIIDESHRDDVDLKIDRFIAQTESSMFQNPVQVLNVRSGETRATALTSGRFLALPDGFLNMRGMRIDTDNGFLPLTYRTPEQLTSIDGPARPRFFTVSSQIEFDTVPDEDYTIEMQYFAEFTPLTDTNQTNTVLTNNPNIYLFGALSFLSIWARDPEQQATYFNLFLDAIRGANKKDRKGRYGPRPVMKLA